MLFAIKLADYGSVKFPHRKFPVSIVSWRKSPFLFIPLSVKVLALNFKAYYGLKMLWKTQSGREKGVKRKAVPKLLLKYSKHGSSYT